MSEDVAALGLAQVILLMSSADMDSASSLRLDRAFTIRRRPCHSVILVMNHMPRRPRTLLTSDLGQSML